MLWAVKVAKGGRVGRVLGLLVMALLVLAGCDERWSWRQKMTVAVETPTGERSGESVLRGSLRHSTGGPYEARGAFFYQRGEAVVVEVAPGKYLFALLNGMPTPFSVFFPGEAPEKMADLLEDLRETREVPPDLYPLMVTFDDVADPRTVRRVDPDDLDATLGCDRYAASAPWREAGVTYRRWRDNTVRLLATQGAAERAGLSGESAAWLTVVNLRKVDGYTLTEEEQAIYAKGGGSGRDDREKWDKAYRDLAAEIPATLPSPESVAAGKGGPCHRLTSVTMEITDAPATEGRVEGVLGWLGPLNGRYLHGDSTSRGAPLGLMGSDFVRN